MSAFCVSERHLGFAFWSCVLCRVLDCVLEQHLEILYQTVRFGIAFCNRLGSFFRNQTFVCATVSHGNQFPVQVWQPSRKNWFCVFCFAFWICVLSCVLEQSGRQSHTLAAFWCCVLSSLPRHSHRDWCWSSWLSLGNLDSWQASTCVLAAFYLRFGCVLRQTRNESEASKPVWWSPVDSATSVRIHSKS